MNKCMICKQEKPLHKDSYFRYKDRTLTEKLGFVCGECAVKESRKVAKAYAMMARLKEDIAEIENKIGLTV